ncbi:hypothetical protein J7438_21255 [Thalassotalea sp. G20_0]|uniref:hypothetical protein n=1 Tax=Thalassotalea sp. G20_0 TaxID=2821093 RepID=UPI001ADBFB61|nr:hypothetical protein [Thalassotalea sp. G20_0]MBO9496591.1 hypothetical protein [Thalassotalea sp. G20_0]
MSLAIIYHDAAAEDVPRRDEKVQGVIHLLTERCPGYELTSGSFVEHGNLSLWL